MYRLSCKLECSTSWKPQGLFRRLQVMFCPFSFDIHDHRPRQDISPLHVTKSTSYSTQHFVWKFIFRQLLTLRLHLLYHHHFTFFRSFIFLSQQLCSTCSNALFIDISQLTPHFILAVPPSIAERSSRSCTPFIPELPTSFLQGKYY